MWTDTREEPREDGAEDGGRGHKSCGATRARKGRKVRPLQPQRERGLPRCGLGLPVQIEGAGSAVSGRHPPRVHVARPWLGVCAGTLLAALPRGGTFLSFINLIVSNLFKTFRTVLGLQRR